MSESQREANLKEMLGRLTPEQRQLCEWLSDPWRRMNNLYWIEDVNGHKIKFRCTKVQWMFYRHFHWLNVVLKARQTKISTICALMMLDMILFSPNQTCGIIDKTDEDAKRKLSRIKFAYDHLDDYEDPQTASVGRWIKSIWQVRYSNAHEFALNNDSKVWASTSLRGGTINFLWITELGPISVEFPEKAREIVAGALNTVHAKNPIVIESTHRGGRYGRFYEMIRLAQSCREPLNEMQWRFHFFGWHDDPSYKLALDGPLQLTPAQDRYFEMIEKVCNKKLKDEQKHWYVRKASTQKIDMSLEFPGTAEEALQAMSEGSIYGDQIALLRAKGRVCDFESNASFPIYAFWDIGMSDYTSIWLVQFAHLDIMALDYHCGNGMTPGQHGAKMLEWERKYRKPVRMHFLPHDASNRGLTGKTYVELLRDAGIEQVKVVPRTPDLWVGINYLRDLLPRFWFHSINCERVFENDSGTIIPSGLGCIEGYHKKVELAGGRIMELPVHDEASHGADALRTLAEAHHRGMLVGETNVARENRSGFGSHGKPIVKSGLRNKDVFAAAAR